MSVAILVGSIITGVALFFVMLWMFLTKLFSVVSGWQKLATAFPGEGIIESDCKPRQTARIGNVLYRRCLVWGTSETGFFMRTMALFKSFHAPLVIPWTEITIRPVRFMFQEGYELSVQSVPGFKMQVRKIDFDHLIREYRLKGGRMPDCDLVKLMTSSSNQ